MTDQFKEITKVKVLDAMIAEGLTNKEAASAIGIPGNYLSMIKHPDQWPKCPAQAWVKTVNWVNSGQTLREYAVKHGRFKPDIDERPAEDQPPPLEPAIRVKPEALEKRRKELAKERKITAPLKVEKAIPSPGTDFTDTARLKVCLDVEINLLVNGQKVQLT